MKLHLIRHGDTEGTQRHLYYGKTDLPLTPEGVSHLTQKVAMGGYPSVDHLAVYSTGMLRTEQTLALIYGDVPHATLPLLQEIDCGIFEMESHETLQHLPAYQAWISGDFTANVPPQGESYQQFSCRVCQGLEALLAKGEDAIVVCHGGTISVIMEHFFSHEEKIPYGWVPQPGTGYSLDLTATACYEPLPQPHWVGKAYAFFQNTACEYFPCHNTDHPQSFNCLFCYCPLYTLGAACGGHFSYTQEGMKDCSNCTLPHEKSNYGYIIKQLQKRHVPLETDGKQEA